MFPMGSGPRLYTESHVAAECYRVIELSSYRVIENGARERKMVIEEVKVQSSNEVLI
jgi:hypothetical protein